MDVFVFILTFVILVRSLVFIRNERRRSEQRRRWYAEVERNRSDNLT